MKNHFPSAAIEFMHAMHLSLSHTQTLDTQNTHTQSNAHTQSKPNTHSDAWNWKNAYSHAGIDMFIMNNIYRDSW